MMNHARVVETIETETSGPWLQARRYLVHRVFWRRAHPPAIAGALGIAIALMGRQIDGGEGSSAGR